MMKNNQFFPRLMTIVSTEESVGAGTGEANPTHETVIIKTERLERFTIYSTEQLSAMGIKLGYLDMNRDVDDGAVKKKIKSIKKVKGVISPTLVVSARKCLQEGLEIHFADGTPITSETPDLDKIYIIVDGQHREEATQRIRKSTDEKEKYSNYYQIPLVEEENIVVSDLLREANVSTFAWKDRQYLSNLLVIKQGKVDFSLDLLKAVEEHPEGKTKAIYRWLTLNASRTIYSRDITDASMDDEKLKKLAEVDPEVFSMGKKLFEIARTRFGEAEAAKTVYPDWVISAMEDKPKVAKLDVAKYIGDFLQNLATDKVKSMKEAKGDPKTKVTRDMKITEILNKSFNAYWAKKPDLAKISL